MATRRLDRRTVAISAVIALIAAGVAALITVVVLSDDDEPVEGGPLQLTEQADVDVEGLLTVPLATADGDVTDLGTWLDGRPLLVNFWQSSCAPCIDEMPLLDRAATERADELDVVGIATQDRPDDAADLAEQTAITYPWALDPDGAAFYEARGAGMPTTVLLDPDGRVLDVETGAFADAAELDAFLDPHLPG